MFGIRTPAKRPNELDRESSPNERAMAGPSRVRRSIGEWEAENQDLDPGAQNKKTNQAQTRNEILENVTNRKDAYKAGESGLQEVICAMSGRQKWQQNKERAWSFTEVSISTRAAQVSTIILNLWDDGEYSKTWRGMSTETKDKSVDQMLQAGNLDQSGI
ncbi:unnamed protein product, partial [Iphiclides podalirius]